MMRLQTWIWDSKFTCTLMWVCHTKREKMLWKIQTKTEKLKIFWGITEQVFDVGNMHDSTSKFAYDWKLEMYYIKPNFPQIVM